jgi:hypothetical protein
VLSVNNLQAELASAKAAADEAAGAEKAARCERKQMEATLALVRQECAQRANRTEQGTLDEIARMQGEWTRRSLSRRDL